MKKSALVLCLFLCSLALSAQIDWYANFYNLMDNREYDTSVGNPQSILGARLDFAVGLEHDSTGTFFVGLNYMYEYGAPIDAIAPALNLYYQIERDDFRSYIGSFEKDGKIDFPKAMIGDSTNYYSPNMGGMYYEFIRKNATQNVFVDWVGRQSAATRESFVAGFSGLYKPSAFYLQNYGYMLHVAGTAVYDTIGVRDNGIGSLSAGVDMSDYTFFDELKLDAGPILNYDRVRPADYGINTGIMVRLNAHYKRVGLDVTSYWGDGLSTSLGDQLYKNGDYTRMDFCIVPLKGEHIESVFKWCYHITGGVGSSSQQFFLIARF